ncbi:CopG family transcriptional regulator [Rhizobium sp. P32RR-XVIII]|uniref:CopG family ribbon-helix-helix protein n=1 Tax=Rhizobium sp. P32RR-XVIII TaxID=2726738 RepID=UPI0014564DAD|nr:ribbon-helix-helix domain-containing protein [Rhizobium sp. P32RR-XVIII]NLS04474.1 CopG family transcriptional regulator [Rhizobium sp. P32RR-XVIII]
METKMLAAHIPLPLAGRLDETAAQLGISRDFIVSEAIAAWLDREEERRLTALRAMAGAGALVLVERHRVRDWADSL